MKTGLIVECTVDETKESGLNDTLVKRAYVKGDDEEWEDNELDTVRCRDILVEALACVITNSKDESGMLRETVERLEKSVFAPANVSKRKCKEKFYETRKG